MTRIFIALVWVLAASSAAAQTYTREELRIPMTEAGSSGLEALLVRPDAPGKYPLAILSHGAPRKAEDRKTMSPNGQYAVALEFARRGYAALIVMRRGYGTSGGNYAEDRGPCSNPNYIAPTKASVRDLKAAIAAAAQRNDIDATRILSVGRSAGGMATVGLVADAPPGLVAGISFAGGRGSRADDDVCGVEKLVEAFRSFGKTARLPMLWVYADNDRFFSPALGERFRSAFAAGGGKVQFIKAPAFGKDGHGLFSRNGIPQWTPMVDAFLKEHQLTGQK